jgi:RNA polymerase sigma factor (sigma-70 family)
VTSQPVAEGLLRELAPQVLAALLRREPDFAAAEDAVQEALLAAAEQWPGEGVPDSPRGWLVTVASRRLIDWRRRESQRRTREAAAVGDPAAEHLPDEDDSLRLLVLCCHPALTVAAQVPLVLRAVGGLTTAEIARAFGVPEATMAQRIVRAKNRIRASPLPFRLPYGAERAERLDAVRQVLYLVFNEGYAASSGPDLVRGALTGEAIRLTRQLHAALPDDGETAGLLALMLLTEARRATRTDGGRLVPLAEQNRGRWDAALIAEGVTLLTRALTRAPVGPYQLQAAIAAVHAEAPDAAATDWPQIKRLYELLAAAVPSPVVTLNAAVAVAMVDGPDAGLELVERAAADPRLMANHRPAAVRAHLLELAGRLDEAREQYGVAARATLSVPERRYLEGRAARLA